MTKKQNKTKSQQQTMSCPCTCYILIYTVCVCLCICLCMCLQLHSCIYMNEAQRFRNQENRGVLEVLILVLALKAHCISKGRPPQFFFYSLTYSNQEIRSNFPPFQYGQAILLAWNCQKCSRKDALGLPRLGPKGSNIFCLVFFG